MSAPRIAIVAALEREVRPLVKNWPRRRAEFDGRKFEFFETDRVVLVCSGIGTEHARRATEAVIQIYKPGAVISAGFAGALQSNLHVGQVMTPRTVIDGSDGSRTDTGTGAGILVTFGVVADLAQKAKLARAFAAQAVDMEGAAVARGAETHGVRFLACKAISDDSSFSMPALAHFVGVDGKFQTWKFAFHVALRPWLWSGTAKLARDTALASRELCKSLAAFAGTDEERVALPATANGKP